MDVEQLRLFSETARRLSFAAVGRDRGVSASTISRAVAAIEDELGVRLLQRSTRTMALTEAGALFHRRVAAMLEEFDRAEEEARGARSGPRGVLRLTTSVAFGECMLTPMIGAFREKYPDIRLELLYTDAVVDLVAEGIDLAIRLAARPEVEAVATRLMKMRYRVYASPLYLEREGRPERPSDLAGRKCLLYTLPAFRSEWKFRLRRASAGGRIIKAPIAGDVAISSPISLRTAAIAGEGPALLADWLAARDLAEGRLVDLFPDYEASASDFDAAAWILYPSRSWLPAKVRATIDFLKERLGD